jgi:hypothetical protein
MAMPWPAYLDALEEWTRRADTAVRGGEDALEPLAADPEGPVPAELALRARALLDRMRQLQTLAERRRRELDRARSYEQD